MLLASTALIDQIRLGGLRLDPFPYGTGYCRDGETLSMYLLDGTTYPGDDVARSAVSEWLFTTDREELTDWQFAVTAFIGGELYTAHPGWPRGVPDWGHFAAAYVLGYKTVPDKCAEQLASTLTTFVESELPDRVRESDTEHVRLWITIIQALSGKPISPAQGHELSKVDLGYYFPRCSGWSLVHSAARTPLATKIGPFFPTMLPPAEE